MTDRPDPTALRLEGQRLVEAAEAANIAAQSAYDASLQSSDVYGAWLEKSRERDRWFITNGPTLLQSLAALTEERDAAVKRAAAMEGALKAAVESAPV